MTSKKQLYLFVFLYIGLILICIKPIFSFAVPYPEVLLLDVTATMGYFIVASSLLLHFYDKICTKIDSTVSQATALDELGIEQIFKYKYDKLETLLSENRSINIAINARRLESFGVILDSIVNSSGFRKTHFNILIVGDFSISIEQVLDSLKISKAHNTMIKAIQKADVDNVIILDQKTCTLNYPGLDNNLDYICVYYNFSEFSKKSKSLFEDLWHDNSAELVE